MLQLPSCFQLKKKIEIIVQLSTNKMTGDKIESKVPKGFKKKN